MDSVWAILVAGGIGKRFGGEIPKQFRQLAGKRVLDYSLEVFAKLKELSGIVLVLPEDFIPSLKKELEGKFPVEIRFVSGGLTRQGSVRNGIRMIDPLAKWVVIHDVARPLVTLDIVRKVFHAAQREGAAVPAVAVSDTLKKGDVSHLVVKTISRDHLYQIQTPQAFSKDLLVEALNWADDKGLDATDEAGLFESIGHRVRLVESSPFNFKLTRPEDFQLAEAFLKNQPGAVVKNSMRIGEGYDVHPFVEGRDLILGGVKIPFEMGLKGHSDADALLHAIGDSILGALAEGDLGKHFPDTDPKYRGISSLKLLEEIFKLVEQKGYVIANLDATVICQKPKLAPYIQQMRQNIAEVLHVPEEAVNVKATTEEGLGFTGTMQGLAAKAVVLLCRGG